MFGKNIQQPTLELLAKRVYLFRYGAVSAKICSAGYFIGAQLLLSTLVFEFGFGRSREID